MTLQTLLDVAEAASPKAPTGPTAPGPGPDPDARAADPAARERETPAMDDVSRHLRTQFLRRIAHDIASPTGVTLTVLEELANEGAPRPELVAMARRSLRRLMRLSEHLALVAELEAGPLEPELGTSDVRALAKQALDDALAIDGRKDVVATSDLPASALVLDADGRLLLVALREVIGNALRLASSRVTLSLTLKDEAVVVRVDDDGPGFAQDARAHFGRRFTGHPTRGLGLSLSMAVEIVEAHGGTIDVVSSQLPPGRKGTTGAAVVVTLPSRLPAPPRNDAP